MLHTLKQPVNIKQSVENIYKWHIKQMTVCCLSYSAVVLSGFVLLCVRSTNLSLFVITV